MRIEEYISSQLNAEQSKAALHIDTSSLIIAGAGSGKTRTLTYKIAYLIFGKDVHYNKILAVTFTNKAAAEMKERLVKYLHFNRRNLLRNLECSNDFLEIFNLTNRILGEHSFRDLTFHSIFLKMLKEDIEKLDMKYTKNFGIFDTNESQSVIKDVLKQLWMVDIFKPQEVKSFISTQKNNWFDPKMFSKQAILIMIIICM
jgi:DNA helicase II / ATP-dependent DNA helicase PcrA